jgi:hypothetical protein
MHDKDPVVSAIAALIKVFKISYAQMVVVDGNPVDPVFMKGFLVWFHLRKNIKKALIDHFFFFHTRQPFRGIVEVVDPKLTVCKYDAIRGLF